MVNGAQILFGVAESDTHSDDVRKAARMGAEAIQVVYDTHDHWVERDPGTAWMGKLRDFVRRHRGR